MTQRSTLRFESLVNASRKLANSAVLETLTELEEEGLIKRFEYTFELSWKAMKDYLGDQGVSTQFPREVIKEAFRHGLIHNGDLWLGMLESRNLTAHIYDSDTIKEIAASIKTTYSKAISNLVLDLQTRK